MNDFSRELQQAMTCEDPAQQAKMLEHLAKRGCAEAQYHLAVSYYEGRGVARDVAMSIGWLRQAAAAGDEDAPSFLGGLLLDSEDAAEAAEGERLCLELAAHGDVVACTNLGNHYYNQDRDEEAARLFRTAADENFSPALKRLGECYLHGYGVRQNHDTAFRLFRKAAELGNIPACYFAAMCCYVGVGTEKNDEEGDRWLQPAVEAGFLPALEMHGAKLADTPETQEEGIRCLTLAAEGGSPRAMFLLFRIFDDRGESEQAAPWLHRAAEAGNHEAQCKLGTRLMQEASSPQEEEEALSWLQRSAEAGDTEAEFCLGLYYEQHPECPESESLAFRHMAEAAARDFMPAIYHLSKFYFHGIGVRRNDKKSLSMLKYAADSGYSEAAYTYGRRLQFGQRCPRNEAEGRRYLDRAARAGNGEAAYHLALCYLIGKGVPNADEAKFRRYMKAAVRLGLADEAFDVAQQSEAEDSYGMALDLYLILAESGYVPALSCAAYLLKHRQENDAALRLFRKGAQQGDADCLAGYAEMTEESGDDDRTQQKAFRLWQRAAAAGNELAEFAVAYRYDVGKGVRRNNRKAIELYHVLLEKREDAEAAYNLACNYYWGHGTKVNYELAVHFFRMAHRLGDHDAALYLGRCYLNGWGVEADGAEAVLLLTEAANHGNTKAMNELAKLYYFGKGGHERDTKAAARWWRKGAEGGSAQCMFDYALCLSDGEGVRRNYRKALEWHRKGAAQNHPECFGSLGCHYFYGLGVKRNYAEAVAYFRRCLELSDDPVAAYNLGARYFHGQGVERNDDEALRYFRQAAKHDYADAIAMLGYMHEKGRGVECDLKQAISFYRRAVKGGSAAGAYELGRCYERGIGVAKNRRRALELYQSAAAKDDSDAKRALKRLARKSIGD